MLIAKHIFSNKCDIFLTAEPSFYEYSMYVCPDTGLR